VNQIEDTHGKSASCAHAERFPQVANDITPDVAAQAKVAVVQS